MQNINKHAKYVPSATAKTRVVYIFVMLRFTEWTYVVGIMIWSKANIKSFSILSNWCIFYSWYNIQLLNCLLTFQASCAIVKWSTWGDFTSSFIWKFLRTTCFRNLFEQYSANVCCHFLLSLRPSLYLEQNLLVVSHSSLY